MKKMIVLIVILSIIYVSLFIDKKIELQNEKKTVVSIDEVIVIETYLEKIYMWQEITNEALPEFEDINDADELWIWNVVGKNIEEQEIEYSEIQKKAVELLGNDFKLQFPEEGGYNYVYIEEEDIYMITGISLDAQNDSFYIMNIEKNGDEYIVDVAEYLEDYDVTSGQEEEFVYIKSTKREILGKVAMNELKNMGKEIVKENISKCTQKRIVLKKENEKIYVKSIDKIN